MARKAVEPKKKEIKEDTLDITSLKKELEDFALEEKNNIINEISTKVDEQIELKVTKRLKEEEKKINRGKTGKIIRRDIIIILLLAVIGYFGYCLFDVDYFNIRTKVVEKPSNSDNKNPSVKEPDNNDEPVVDKHDTAYYIENYGYLIDNLLIEDESVYSLFSDTTKENIKNELVLKIAYKNLHQSGITIEQNMLTFKSSEMLTTARKIFGANINVTNEMFNYNNIKFMFYNDTYLGLVEEETNVGLLTRIEGAKEVNDRIIFDIIIAKLTPENKLLNQSNEVVLEEYHDEDLLNLKDKLTTYQISFEKENDNYIFDNIKAK